MTVRALIASTSLLVLAFGVPVAGGSPGHAVTPSKRCNGHVELCARRLDEVVLAGTHNSMQSSHAGFTPAVQERTIREQLDGGIRALLLDVYQGTPKPDGSVCTDPTPLKVEQLVRDLGKDVVDALISARNSSCPPAGSPESRLYLCHGFCETGASSFDEQLAQIREFLVENPGESVALVLEDYADASDIVEAFDAAGLSKYLLERSPRAKWPKLGKMVSSNKRLVVFAQNQGGSAPWLLRAFEEMQDTPYRFLAAAEMSCAPNRGPASARLFLLNHWLSVPDARAGAQEANTRDVLLARARRCEEERGRGPNVIAVNIAEVGDLLSVVDELNGVPTAPARP